MTKREDILLAMCGSFSAAGGNNNGTAIKLYLKLMKSKQRKHNIFLLNVFMSNCLAKVSTKTSIEDIK